MLQNKAWIEKHLMRVQAQQQTAASIKKLTADEIRQLAKQALEVIPARVQHYASLIGVTYGRITIRNQRSKWGSCSSKGNLNFNYRLHYLPQELMDYVVVHELAHRVYMNHSDKFWALVERYIPDYKECQRRLREIGIQ